jgi:hypothetical protein
MHVTHSEGKVACTPLVSGDPITYVMLLLCVCVCTLVSGDPITYVMLLLCVCVSHGHGHGLFIKTRVTEKFTPFPRRAPAVTPTCLELPYMKCA